MAFSHQIIWKLYNKFVKQIEMLIFHSTDRDTLLIYNMRLQIHMWIKLPKQNNLRMLLKRNRQMYNFSKCMKSIKKIPFFATEISWETEDTEIKYLLLTAWSPLGSDCGDLNWLLWTGVNTLHIQEPGARGEQWRLSTGNSNIHNISLNISLYISLNISLNISSKY